MCVSHHTPSTTLTKPPNKAVYLESEPFSLQNNLLTPTQKLKRMEARERYQAIISELYGKLEQKRAIMEAAATKGAVSRL